MLREEVLKFLQSNDVRLNTDIGQHFLIDPFVLETILEAAKLKANEHVIEVGPGIGVLTRELLGKQADVTAIEIDPRFIPLLKAFVKPIAKSQKLQAILGNALHIPPPTQGPYKVVANIPYHITSPLLHHFLLEATVRPASMTVLIQKEVAENICDDGSRSILTVLVKLFGKPTLECIVPPACFVPPPAVDSAVIHIECFNEPIVDTETAKKVLALAKHAMSGRRKMLNNTIGKLPGGSEALKNASIPASLRPQDLSVEQWIALEKILRATRAQS